MTNFEVKGRCIQYIAYISTLLQTVIQDLKRTKKCAHLISFWHILVLYVIHAATLQHSMELFPMDWGRVRG